MSIADDRWQRVRDLFERALEVESADLGAWLDREAGGDAEVRAEVASLLDHHSAAGSFLIQPVTESLPQLLTDRLALVPGQRLGSYTIVRELGRGGMGRVYLATDERLGRTVALKALPPRWTSDSVGRERLRREARAAAALTHPGICTVYALEEFEGELFIAAEFVDGHPLRDEIAGQRRPSADDVLQTARELAAALASAHVKGITHRDLKPENVMRAKDGRLKILDFGLALTEDISAGQPAGLPPGEPPRMAEQGQVRMTGPAPSSEPPPTWRPNNSMAKTSVHPRMCSHSACCCTSTHAARTRSPRPPCSAPPRGFSRAMHRHLTPCAPICRRNCPRSWSGACASRRRIGLRPQWRLRTRCHGMLPAARAAIVEERGGARTRS